MIEQNEDIPEEISEIHPLNLKKVTKMGQNDLVKTLRMNYLFDFYQSLLTNKQKNYLELFYLQDYSFK